jgi:hypothetical protein
MWYRIVLKDGVHVIYESNDVFPEFLENATTPNSCTGNEWKYYRDTIVKSIIAFRIDEIKYIMEADEDDIIALKDGRSK